MTDDNQNINESEQLQQIAASEGLATNESGELVLGGFTLTPTSLVPQGAPSFEDWDRVGTILRYFHTGMQFWLGDWMNFGEQAYGEKYSQALKETDYELKTLQTYAWVARSVKPAQRVEAVPFGHYANGIAALDEKDQKRWVKKILEDGEDGVMTQAEFKKALRLEKRTKNVDAGELPTGKFRVLYADFPWQYDDAGVIENDNGTEAYGKAERHYPTMSVDEMIDFGAKVKEIAADDAVMFFWVPAPILLQKPGPREVIEACGFEPKTGMVWDKQVHNYGHYVSVRHEHLIICTRGSCTPDQPTPMPDSVISIAKSKKHSEKPEEFRRTILQLYTEGPYLELFGREDREGWTIYGNDANLTRAEATVDGKEIKKVVVEEGDSKKSKNAKSANAKTTKSAQSQSEPVASGGAVELCKKHRKEPKPCQKCKEEKQRRSKSKA